MNSFGVRAAMRAPVPALVESGAAPAAFAAEPAPREALLHAVYVSPQTDPERKTYRDMIWAAAMFAAYRHRHPDAQWQFGLRARKFMSDRAGIHICRFDSETCSRMRGRDGLLSDNVYGRATPYLLAAVQRRRSRFAAVESGELSNDLHGRPADSGVCRTP